MIDMENKVNSCSFCLLSLKWTVQFPSYRKIWDVILPSIFICHSTLCFIFPLNGFHLTGIMTVYYHCSAAWIRHLWHFKFGTHNSHMETKYDSLSENPDFAKQDHLYFFFKLTFFARIIIVSFYCKCCMCRL